MVNLLYFREHLRHYNKFIIVFEHLRYIAKNLDYFGLVNLHNNEHNLKITNRLIHGLIEKINIETKTLLDAGFGA